MTDLENIFFGGHITGNEKPLLPGVYLNTLTQIHRNNKGIKYLFEKSYLANKSKIAFIICSFDLRVNKKML